VVRFLFVALLTMFTINAFGQNKKAVAPQRAILARPINQWWWGYSGREVRQQVLKEIGWFPTQPSDSCTFCTAFKNGFDCRIEFAYHPDGLWRRSWKIPRDSQAAQQWDLWFQSTSPPSYQDAPINERTTQGNGDYSTRIWREECGDFIIYTAVAEDNAGTPGPGVFGRQLRDCKQGVN
jgi:hypothetical protein